MKFNHFLIFLFKTSVGLAGSSLGLVDSGHSGQWKKGRAKKKRRTKSYRISSSSSSVLRIKRKKRRAEWIIDELEDDARLFIWLERTTATYKGQEIRALIRDRRVHVLKWVQAGRRQDKEMQLSPLILASIKLETDSLPPSSIFSHSTICTVMIQLMDGKPTFMGRIIKSPLLHCHLVVWKWKIKRIEAGNTTEDVRLID